MTQKITIEPVTRIEGHAKVTIHMKDDGTVDHAYMHVNEFRGFEKFCEGRLYFEMPQITPRICGICPVSHHPAPPTCYANSCTWDRSSKAMACTSSNLPDLTCF